MYGRAGGVRWCASINECDGVSEGNGRGGGGDSVGVEVYLHCYGKGKVSEGHKYRQLKDNLGECLVLITCPAPRNVCLSGWFSVCIYIFMYTGISLFLYVCISICLYLMVCMSVSICLHVCKI